MAENLVGQYPEVGEGNWCLPIAWEEVLDDCSLPIKMVRRG
jgi:hypothetical protein